MAIYWQKFKSSTHRFQFQTRSLILPYMQVMEAIKNWVAYIPLSKSNFVQFFPLKSQENCQILCTPSSNAPDMNFAPDNLRTNNCAFANYLQWENHDDSRWFPDYSVEVHEKVVAFFWCRLLAMHHPFSFFSLHTTSKFFNTIHCFYPAIENKTIINN